MYRLIEINPDAFKEEQREDSSFINIVTLDDELAVHDEVEHFICKGYEALEGILMCNLHHLVFHNPNSISHRGIRFKTGDVVWGNIVIIARNGSTEATVRDVYSTIECVIEEI